MARSLVLVAGVAVACAPAGDAPPEESATATEWQPTAPSLHHSHLNTVDAQGAIDGYLALWPDGERGEVAGYPAFIAEMSVLFNEVDAPPPGAWDHELQRAAPQSAFWHIGGFVNTTDVFEKFAAQGIEVLKLRSGPDDAEGVYRSGQTPYGGIRTTAQLDTAQAVEAREGGFGYVVGPDGALVELTGSPRTTPSFSHVHLFHEQPLCAANWYVENLGMALPPRRDRVTGDTISQTVHEDCAAAPRGDAGWPSLEDGGTIRAPRGTVRHANGSLSFYPRQCDDVRCGDDQPLVPSRGQVLDHVGFTVTDLERWVTHLRAQDVVVSEGPYAFGNSRAVMIEGPDGLGIELVEAY